MNAGHTCGLACWTAMDDVCHCSCGGVNHGCMRAVSGVQPIRSRKHQGVFYELVAVVKGYGEMLKLRQEHPEYFTGTYMSKVPSKKEVASWPELAQFREHVHSYEWYTHPAVCLWVKSDKYK